LELFFIWQMYILFLTFIRNTAHWLPFSTGMHCPQDGTCSIHWTRCLPEKWVSKTKIWNIWHWQLRYISLPFPHSLVKNGGKHLNIQYCIYIYFYVPRKKNQ
jgi:hypothetical protein